MSSLPGPVPSPPSLPSPTRTAPAAKSARRKPKSGESTMKAPVVSRPGQMTAPTPALVRPAPTNPPISACELLDGMPAHRVMRFKRIAHLWSVFGGHDSISRVLSANARPWSQSLTRQHVPMFHEGTNNLSQIGLTHASGSLSGRMPLGPSLALFGPSLELTRYAQRKHTDLAPHSGARFKYLVIPVRTYRLFADFSDHAGFCKGFLRSGTVRRRSALRPAFWNYPSSRAARRHQQNLHSGFDFSIRKGTILNWPT